MKRFALFAGMIYYPSGGWGDFRDSYDTQPEAWEAGVAGDESGKWDWWHIIDLQTGEMVG